MNDITLTINTPTIIFFSITLLAIGVCLFLIGYFYGLSKNTNGVFNMVSDRPKNFFDDKVVNNKKISIDSTKVVTDIKTDNLEKKYESLGEFKQSEDNISGSISKLKNLKR